MTHFYNSMPSRLSILAFFKMTAILLLWSPVSFINAQSPIAVLENADGDTVLSSYSDGSLLLPGKLGTGNIPVEGSGVRMMWYPGLVFGCFG